MRDISSLETRMPTWPSQLVLRAFMAALKRLQPDVSEWTMIGNMYGLQNWYIQIFHLVKLYATTCYWAVVLISERMMPVSMGSRECATHQTMASSWRLRLEAQYISRCNYWALGDVDLSSRCHYWPLGELPATGFIIHRGNYLNLQKSFWEEDLDHFSIHGFNSEMCWAAGSYSSQNLENLIISKSCVAGFQSAISCICFKDLQSLEEILPCWFQVVQGAQRHILPGGSADGNFVCEGYGTLKLDPPWCCLVRHRSWCL